MWAPHVLRVWGGGAGCSTGHSNSPRPLQGHQAAAVMCECVATSSFWHCSLCWPELALSLSSLFALCSPCLSLCAVSVTRHLLAAARLWCGRSNAQPAASGCDGSCFLFMHSGLGSSAGCGCGVPCNRRPHLERKGGLTGPTLANKCLAADMWWPPMGGDGHRQLSLPAVCLNGVPCRAGQGGSLFLAMAGCS